MKTMLLWLMVAPGPWEMYVDVYKDAAECKEAETVLAKVMPKIDLSNHPKKRSHIRKIYFEGSSGPGIYRSRCY